MLAYAWSVVPTVNPCVCLVYPPCMDLELTCFGKGRHQCCRDVLPLLELFTFTFCKVHAEKA